MKFFATLVMVLLITSISFADEREQVERLAEKYHAKTEVKLAKPALSPITGRCRETRCAGIPGSSDGTNASGQRPAVSNDTPIRVYFIHDPVDDKWYNKVGLGFTIWGNQNEAYVWTVKRNANRTLMALFGRRAKRCVIKAFVLIPAKDNK